MLLKSLQLDLRLRKISYGVLKTQPASVEKVDGIVKYFPVG